MEIIMMTLSRFTARANNNREISTSPSWSLRSQSSSAVVSPISVYRYKLTITSLNKVMEFSTLVFQGFTFSWRQVENTESIVRSCNYQPGQSVRTTSTKLIRVHFTNVQTVQYAENPFLPNFNPQIKGSYLPFGVFPPLIILKKATILKIVDDNIPIENAKLNFIPTDFSWRSERGVLLMLMRLAKIRG
ncbi:hypothetical protein FGO68_gene7964 [Halteria grandinella]|uniref:Uncharacterized protein n=1 Tax=Halteria grandinella TaxID=5974 RepID=A0A8J8P2R6_HALGN|nr:hypothetical protein FGO68_gene7964 [Halteria grandinella]